MECRFSFREAKPRKQEYRWLNTQGSEAVLKVQLQRRAGKNRVGSNQLSRVRLTVVRLHNNTTFSVGSWYRLSNWAVSAETQHVDVEVATLRFSVENLVFLRSNFETHDRACSCELLHTFVSVYKQGKQPPHLFGEELSVLCFQEKCSSEKKIQKK